MEHNLEWFGQYIWGEKPAVDYLKAKGK
jgi:hypothetical protein